MYHDLVCVSTIIFNLIFQVFGIVLKIDLRAEPYSPLQRGEVPLGEGFLYQESAVGRVAEPLHDKHILGSNFRYI